MSVLVVVTISEGQNFPRCKDSCLVVDGHINGEVLSTDPIPQAGSEICIQTELAWEMERKTLQQHRLHRSPIKLQVFTVDSATSTRQLIGYILLDLRTAQTINTVLPQWHKVLSFCARKTCPELCLSLCIEDVERPKKDEVAVKGDRDVHVLCKPSKQEYPLILHSGGEYYFLGRPLSHLRLIVVSVTIKNPVKLPLSSESYCYCYNFLGNEIISEQFELGDFKPEKASLRIMSTREELVELFSSQQNLKISLCQNGETLGTGLVSLKPLATQDWLESNTEIALNSGSTSFIVVRVQLEQGCLTKSPSWNKNSDVSFTTSHLSSKSGFSPKQGSSELSGGSGGQKSIKRNLTQSFDEVSAQSLDTQNSNIKEEQESSASTHYVLEVGSLSQKESDPHPNCLHSDVQVPVEESSPTPYTIQKSHLTSTTANDFQPYKPSFSPIPFPPAVTQPASVSREGMSCGSTNTPSSNSPLPYPDNSSMAEYDAHQYKYSIHIHSIHNVQIGEGVKCFVKYDYPYFGSLCAVVFQPPISLVMGAENYFSSAISTFNFVSNKNSLMQQLHSHPLTVELWASGEKSESQIGIAKVPLGEVFIKERVVLNNISCQKCSLKVPAMASLSRITCAYIHCSLIFEDYGPVQLSNQEGRNIKMLNSQELPKSREYLAAVELEMWKLSQEEHFLEGMKAKEMVYLHQIGEEWRRREEERQWVFVQKVERYNCLEKQLSSTLQEAQHHQQQLRIRKTEVEQLQHKLTLERQNISDICKARVQQCQVLCEEKVSVERKKSEELIEVKEQLRKQVSDLSRRLTSRDAEFDAYRQQVLSKPESKLQAELTVIHLEKSELERKLSAVLKSKQHYKEKWTRALKELSTYMHEEQATTRDILQKQQQELESIEDGWRLNQECRSLCHHLNQVRDEVRRLQHDTHTSQDSLCQAKYSILKSSVSPDVTRWIEERDILLQTGMYSHNDLTVQRLNLKIREALASSS